MSISKQASKAHLEALRIVQSKHDLSEDEKLFVLEHFDEGAQHLNRIAGAFFTPMGVSENLAIEIDTNDTVIDLCAGTGRLVHSFAHRMKRVVCVEANADYVAVGKKVVPEAEWILGDVFETIEMLARRGDRFNIAISNPPFGRVSTPSYKGVLHSASFEHKVMEAASVIANVGLFIVPHGSAGWLTGPSQSTVENRSPAVAEFGRRTGLVLDALPIEMSLFSDQWKGTSPKVSTVMIDYTAKREVLTLAA